jgi:hypothetical protein
MRKGNPLQEPLCMICRRTNIQYDSNLRTCDDIMEVELIYDGF